MPGLHRIQSFFTEINQLLERREGDIEERLSDGRLKIGRLIRASLFLGAIYGGCLGLYRALTGTTEGFLQLLATEVKVPLLFLLTLFITYPSLYVFSTLAGSRLGWTATLRLLIMAIAVNLAVLASFGPIMVFFVLSSSDYGFVKILNCVFFAVSGLISLGFLTRHLKDLYPKEEESEGEGKRPSKSPAGPRVRWVLGSWLIIYGAVGAQMGWLLRPFIGHPELPFAWLRPRESNFFADVLKTLAQLLS